MCHQSRLVGVGCSKLVEPLGRPCLVSKAVNSPCSESGSGKLFNQDLTK